MPAFTTAAIIGGAAMAAGAIGKVVGGLEGSAAEQDIAKAQRGEAQKTAELAKPTVQEMAQLNDRIQMQTRYHALQESQLAQDQKALAAIDPNLIEAGQQANALLKGKEAAILAPMKQQQQMQRRQLEQQLAAGPGLGSAMAMDQLAKFDMQSNMQTQQAQSHALSQVQSMMGFGVEARERIQASERAGFHTASSMSMGTMSAMDNLQNRQVHAQEGMMKTAGSEHVGRAANANMMSGLGGSLMQIGGSIMGQGMAPPKPQKTDMSGDFDEGIFEDAFG